MSMELQEQTTDFPPVKNSGGKKKAFTVTITVLLAIAIALCIFVMAQVLSKGYVSLGGYSLFRVVTGSMEPEIPVGALLISQETPMEEIQPRDIVTYRSREAGKFGVIITHRVVSVYEGNGGKLYLETKGDANPSSDSDYVDENYLIGKVVFYTGQDNIFSKILNFITGEVGFLACIVLPCMLIGMFVMKDCIKGIRTELDAINQELDTMKQDPEHMTQPEEDYEALRNRLRDELIKELKLGAEPETKEQEPGADAQSTLHSGE
mgnify:CR=1 FL=1